MTNDKWLQHFEEAYQLPFRNDITIDQWEKREFSPQEKVFLLSEYTEEFQMKHQQTIEDIVQIMTRYLFKKATTGYTFCELEKIELMAGKTLEQNFGVFSGYFYNFAKTYWTFRTQLDEETLQYGQKKSTPLFFMILRTIEVNIAGSFFPSGGEINEENQRQILKEFAPEINVEKFISENPMLRINKGGCLGVFIVLPIMCASIIVFAKWIL